MKFNKKFMLSLGAVASFAPIAAVVACGKLQEPTSEQNKQYALWTKPETLKLLEDRWDENVINKVDSSILPNIDRNANGILPLVVDGTKINDYAKFVLKQELLANNQYLNQHVKQIISDRVKHMSVANAGGKITVTLGNEIDEASAKTLGLTYVPEYGQVDLTKVNDEAINILLNFDKSDFKNKVYRQIVSELYLMNTTKNLYQKAFKNIYSLSLTQRSIEDTNFVLVNEAMNQKLFAEWTVSLDDAKSRGYVSAADMTLSQLKAALTNGTTKGMLVSAIDQSVAKATSIFGATDVITDITFNKMIGWKGFVNQQPVGTENLSFTTEELKKVTSWEGAIQDNKLVDAGIKLVQPNTSVVNVTYAKGIMPIYKQLAGAATTDPKFFTLGSTKDELTPIARLLAYKSSIVYSTATSYFRTKVEGRVALDGTTKIESPILLTVKQDDIKKILEDSNFKFITERKAEDAM